MVKSKTATGQVQTATKRGPKRSDVGRKKHNQAKRRVRKALKREQKIKQRQEIYSKFPHPELAPEVGHKTANRAGEVVTRVTSDFKAITEILQYAVKHKIPVHIIGALPELVGTTLEQVCQAAEGVKVAGFSGKNAKPTVPLENFVTNAPQSAKATGTLFSNDQDHMCMEDVFFEPSFQKFRDVVGLTSLEKIGNKIFGKHRWEADNIFVTADVEEILQAHTQPHLDPYDNLVTVATGFKNWKIWKISRAEFMALQAKVPSAKLEEGLNINTFDPFDSKTAEFRHLLPFFTEVKVMPGDLLYVPPVCVHEVLSAPQTVGSTAMSNPKTKDPFAMGAPPSGHDLMDTSK